MEKITIAARDLRVGDIHEGQTLTRIEIVQSGHGPIAVHGFVTSHGVEHAIPFIFRPSILVTVERQTELFEVVGETVVTVEDPERARLIAQAEAYVQSKFFPPLPVEYGRLAVVALEEYREYGPESHVNLPEGLPLLPRGVERDEDGDLFIEARELISILEIEHLIDEED